LIYTPLSLALAIASACGLRLNTCSPTRAAIESIAAITCSGCA
jgi:hypothetical protein